jgi:hypothetical protein
VTDLSGGWLRQVKPDEMTAALPDMFRIIRSRYILEFPRSDKLGGGAHTIRVEISHARASVRPGGTTFPVATVDPNAGKILVEPIPGTEAAPAAAAPAPDAPGP